MSGTIAVPLATLSAADRTSLTGQPLCPVCSTGYLHPYKVEISLGGGPHGWNGANYLTGWVAVCRGNQDHRRAYAEFRAEDESDADEEFEHPPCGFSMPMTAHRWPVYERSRTSP